MGEKKGEEKAEAARPPDIVDLVESMIGVLAGEAWKWMGLVVDPATGQLRRDLDKARLAIDCVDALFKNLDPFLDEDRRRRIRTVISDLRLNFVRQSQLASEGEKGGRGAGEGGEGRREGGG